MIGLRARHEFAPGQRFETRGDIGGFGAGSAFSWQVYGGYSRDFDVNGLKLTGSVGYRPSASTIGQRRATVGRTASTPFCTAPW